jgi:DIS3-like exonuclease 1
VIVHRLLLSALKDQDWWSDTNEQKKVEHMTNSQLSDLCDHINERNKAAQLAQRQSQLLFQTLFFQNKQPDDPRCIVEAVILRIRNNGFLVYVPCYALKGPVYLQDDDENCVLYLHQRRGPTWIKGKINTEEHSISVEPQDGQRIQSYKLFDHVSVTTQVSKSSDAHSKSLVFYLLSRYCKSKEKLDFRSDIQKSTQSAKSSRLFFQNASTPVLERRDPTIWLKENSNDSELTECESFHLNNKKPPIDRISRGKKSVYNFFEEMKMIGEMKERM